MIKIMKGYQIFMHGIFSHSVLFGQMGLSLINKCVIMKGKLLLAFVHTHIILLLFNYLIRKHFTSQHIFGSRDKCESSLIKMELRYLFFHSVQFCYYFMVCNIKISSFQKTKTYLNKKKTCRIVSYLSRNRVCGQVSFCLMAVMCMAVAISC